MARERNRNGLASAKEPTRTAISSSHEGLRDEPDGGGRTSSLLGELYAVPAKGARAFPAVEPGKSAPRSVSRDLALPLVIIALLTIVLAKSLAVRVGVPVILLGTALILAIRPARRAETNRGRGVVFDGERLFFQTTGGEPRAVLSLRDPFGVTLVASPKRDRIVAVWSSPEGLFYIGTSLELRRGVGPLFERAFTVIGDDAALQAIGPDGEPLELDPGDFEALVCAVEELDPACIERIVLSDARGAPLTLDGRELVIGDRRFDLDAPLEWRSFVFQEAFGQAIAVYQGTSIRQGASEAVLVALLPSILPFEPGDEGELDRSIMRDLRLMQASPEDPPPRDVRVAIDRLFVLPVRSALDRSRSASQPSAPSSRSRARA
jgi:hypothetical protein